MKRKGWIQLGKGVNGEWQHQGSGWRVLRCGHPTALWPWYILSPEGQMILSPNGRAWQLLADALDYAEQLAAGLPGSYRSAPSA